MIDIVRQFRAHSIPTVFWITKDHQYHEQYKDFAKHFDFIFCADSKEVELLKADGLTAELLLPCVQPALYNPFRLYDHYNAINLNIIFDGWADLDRMTEPLAVLKKIKPYGLSIIESRYHIFRNRLLSLPEYKENLLGCVTLQSRITALKYAQVYITFDQTLSTQTTRQWMSLEATASRLPILHLGDLAGDDIRKGIALEYLQEMDFLLEFVRFREDPLYRERIAHLCWRKTNQEFTFSHRIRAICKKIGIKHDWQEFPLASIITPTYRREALKRCLNTFEQQTYPNKELIIVFNGAEVPLYTELGLGDPRPDVRLANVPGEMFAGACLNQGYLKSKGEFCFRVDDDDHYGPNYISDMILLSRSIDADFFGKTPAPLFFEEDRSVYARKAIHPISIASDFLLTNGEQWLGGNSIAGKKHFLLNNMYDDQSFGSADTTLLFSVKKESDAIFAIMDPFNLVAERRIDYKTHTWQEPSGKVKKEGEKLVAIDEVMI